MKVNNKKWKVNRKVFVRRLVTLMLSITMVLLLTGSVVAKSTEPNFKEITVKRGDNLWLIAKSCYGNDVNIEKAIYKIKTFNDMSRSDLYPGQTLKIPLNL